MYSTLERYVSAFEAEEYTVQLVHVDKVQFPPVRRKFTPGQLVGSLKFLQHKNALGYNVYARPAGYQYVLLDDLRRESLRELAGMKPSLLMETSPGNYQAFLTFDQVPVSRLAALALCRDVAAYFGADPGSAEPDHVGRLPGFTNRKEKYRNDKGFYPFVQLHGACRRHTCFIPHSGLCAQIIQEVDRSGTPPTREELDRSRQDFNTACMLIRQGKPDAYIRQVLEQTSLKAPGRRDDYVGRTIYNARRLLNIHH